MRSLSCVVMIVLALVLLPSEAAAAVRAFSSRGTAQFVSPTDFVGSGNATHLGAYTEAGSLAFAPSAEPGVLDVTGTIVYTAANGDELHASVAGHLNLLTGAVDAALTYTGGTGRFSHASGASTLTGQLGAGGTISVRVRGGIDY